MSQVMMDLGQGLEIWKIDIDEVREQDINARAMTPEMFDRLSDTIGRDGRLESLPLLAVVNENDESHLEVVSGHHRTRAARQAGVLSIHAIVDTTGLTRDQISAKQLAHNSIAGTDEKSILRQILDSIQDVDARLEAFISPDSIDMPDFDPISLPPLDLDVKYRTTLFTFLPSQAERFDKTVEALVDQADLNRDQLFIADLAMYDRWKAMMSRLGKEYDARALSTVIMRLLDVGAEVLGIDTTTPESIDPEEWVPLAQIFGSALVPPEAAIVMTAAVEKMQKDHELSNRNRWQALEYWAADYLAGH
jgi:hypothetical protein